jgi:hypothetical protein
MCATDGHRTTNVRKRDLSTVIDKVADIYLKVRSDGGRFFIDDQLACYKGETVGDKSTVFVIFQIVD